MNVELSLLPWPAAIVGADSQMHDCNALWKTRFGHCENLESDFPEAAAKLRVVAQQSARHATFLARAPGEIAPLQLRFAALPVGRISENASLYLIIAEDRADAAESPVERAKRDESPRDVEVATDDVALRLEARHWHAFFRDAAASKAIIGLHGETLKVNRALCQLLDRSEHELLQIFAGDLRHPDDRELVGEYFQLLLEGGPPIAGIEARYLHKDGHYLNCLLALSLIRDSRGRPLYFAAEVENITARCQAEARLIEQAEELERANFELTRSNTDLERFAFVVSHDLQEPLRKIRVFGDRLASLAQQIPPDASPNADLTRYIDGMTRAAERMQNLVDALLDYGRLQQRNTPFLPVDLNELWDELREEFETTLRESGAQLHVGVLPVVRGNAFRLRQLFGNLLSNALKFRAEQPPRIEVRALDAAQAQTGATSSQVCIAVQDNGIGFNETHAEAIFEVFGRLHESSRYSGTGIGLSICRRVAHEHGGDVRAFSRSDQGACFVVTLEK